METHITPCKNWNKYQDGETLNDLNAANYSDNSKKPKFQSYWGKLRKAAVKTKLTAPRPDSSQQRIDDSNGKCKLSCEQSTERGGSTAKKCVIDVVIERKKALRFFREQYKLLKKQGGEQSSFRIDLQAWNVVKESGLLLKEDKVIGPVPGVKVEDNFEFRVELVIMGIHSQLLHGIDYMEMPKGGVIATSIVATEGHDDLMVKPDELIYTGEGGNCEANGKRAKDQVLKLGNLALKNSINEGNFVRVVRGIKARNNRTIFVYDGLYKVASFFKELGVHRNLKFKFKLERCSGQKPITWSKYK